MGKLYDKTGREIMPGDVLKVFHFTGARRKRHYMYKHALPIVELGEKDPTEWMEIDHLNFGKDRPYHERADGRVLQDYEIVQSIDAKFEDRPRINTNQ